MNPIYALSFATLGVLAVFGLAFSGGSGANVPPACSFTVHVTESSVLVQGSPVTVQTQLVASSSSCHVVAVTYRYSVVPQNLNQVSGPSFTFVPETPGFYHVTVVVTANFGVNSATTSFHVLPPTS